MHCRVRTVEPSSSSTNSICGGPSALVVTSHHSPRSHRNHLAGLALAHGHDAAHQRDLLSCGRRGVLRQNVGQQAAPPPPCQDPFCSYVVQMPRTEPMERLASAVVSTSSCGVASA